MTPFTVLTGPAAVLDRANIDTDQIIPARFLHQPRNAGYGRFLFADLGLHLPAGATILVAGDNFGCGSSREGAVYALVDAGIRCVIAPGFGDIFAGNAAQNGLLTVTLALPDMRNGDTLTVDLPAATVRLPDGTAHGFAIDPFRKQRLLEGRDDIDLTLTHRADIAAFGARDRTARPWALTGGALTG